MEISQDALELKALLKAAIVEVLQERSDLITDAVEDAFEDGRLVRAMDAAKAEGLADTDHVARLLDIKL